MSKRRKANKQSEWLNGMEVVEAVMEAKGCSRKEAMEEVLEAILTGELKAYSERPN